MRGTFKMVRGDLQKVCRDAAEMKLIKEVLVGVVLGGQLQDNQARSVW